VLVTARPASLLPTVRSRCQRIEIARPDPRVALGWLTATTGGRDAERLLALAGGAPLKAERLAPNFEGLEAQMTELLGALLGEHAEVTGLAEAMMGEGLPARLDWLEDWVGLALRRKALGVETKVTVPGGPLLQRAAAEVNISQAFQIVDRLREARRLLEGSAAPQLLVEALLIRLRTAWGR